MKNKEAEARKLLRAVGLPLDEPLPPPIALGFGTIMVLGENHPRGPLGYWEDLNERIEARVKKMTELDELTRNR